MARPGGTDGSDHQYRMVIENRYEKLAKQRRLIQQLVTLQVGYIVLRVVWHTVPALLADEGIPTQECAYGVAGMLAFMMYYQGSGAGKAQNERIHVLKTYTVLSMLHGALAALASFQYHVMWPDSLRYHHVYAEKVAPILGVNPGIVSAIVKFLAPVIDVVGLPGCFLALYICKDYCMEKTEQAKPKLGQPVAAETNYVASSGRGARRRR